MAQSSNDYCVSSRYFYAESNFSQDSDEENCVNIQPENLHPSFLDQSFFRDALDIGNSETEPCNFANNSSRKENLLLNNKNPKASISFNSNRPVPVTYYNNPTHVYSNHDTHILINNNINSRQKGQFPMISQPIIQTQNYLMPNLNSYQIYINQVYPSHPLHASNYSNPTYYANEKQKLLYFLREQLHLGSLLDIVCSSKSEQLLSSIIKAQFINEDYNYLCDLFLSLKSMHTLFIAEASKKFTKHFLKKISSDKILLILSELKDQFEITANHEVGLENLLYLVSIIKEGVEVKALFKIVQAHLKCLCLNRLSCALIIKIIQSFKPNSEVICNSIIPIQSVLIKNPNGIFILATVYECYEALRPQMVAEITTLIKDIVVDCYAIQFLQYVIENSTKKERKPISEILIEKAGVLCINRYSCAVLLKLSDKGSSIELKKLTKILFNPDNLLNAYNSKIGRYLVEYLIPKLSSKLKGQLNKKIETSIKYEGLKGLLVKLNDSLESKDKANSSSDSQSEDMSS